MKLTLADLKRYRRMTNAERNNDPIKEEIYDRMRWMPEKWRRIVKVRYIERRSVAYTCMELHIGKTTYLRRTKELAEWLEDTEKYLREQV